MTGTKYRKQGEAVRAGRRRYLWAPRMPLAVYAAYMALLFSLGQRYVLIPWLLFGAVAVGIPALFIIVRGLRKTPRSHLWFVSGPDGETGGGRPGLGLLLIVLLTGPVPFLLAAAVQHWLLGLGVGTVWVLACSAAAVFGLIFGGYCLIEGVLNRKLGSASTLRS